MAIYLFRIIRRKYRERQAQKAAIPTTDESHLVPEPALGQEHDEKLHGYSGQSGALAQSSSPPQVQKPSVNAAEIAQHKAEKRRRTIRQWKLLLGLMLPNFLAAIDVTIVAPAIPLISSHFSMFVIS